MELTTKQKIKAWEKVKICLEIRNRWFGLCGICSDLLNNSVLNGNEFYHVKRSISVDMEMKGKSRTDLMFDSNDKESRIKYINNKIKQLENEK